LNKLLKFFAEIRKIFKFKWKDK